MTSKTKPPRVDGNVLKNLAGLFVIWLSLYLVALAQDLSTPDSKRSTKPENPIVAEQVDLPQPDVLEE